eukprot:TRINITY_DN2326_c0_g2_i1.p1 TRINITY_DN2326_c0_g2~~TRINITY_DN2326_c0_g2_i1.p1  ORF type:complete len:493 (+),score=111.58 TRINITY_DN2326_c0_g2_i1:1626-3104(+)
MGIDDAAVAIHSDAERLSDERQSLLNSNSTSGASPVSSFAFPHKGQPAGGSAAPVVPESLKIVVASVGFFTDAYDLFVISMVMVILQELYGITPEQSSLISSTALAGAVTGQLTFGFLGDLIGRTGVWVITLTLIIVGDAASAFAFGQSSWDIAIWLALWRLLLGLGIGGEYPLAATVSSEASTDHTKRGTNIAMVFASQGWGNLFSPVLILFLLKVFPENSNSLGFIWRIALGFSCLPCLSTLYFRFRIFRSHGTQEQKKRKNVPWHVTLNTVKSNWRKLLGTAGAWFIFDVTFYANGLFSATLLKLLHLDNSTNVYQRVTNVAQESALIACMSLPGYYSAVFLIDRVGRRFLQQFGFLMMAVMYFIMGFFFNQVVKYQLLFVILYGLSFYFSNIGPNTTTFVVPSEVYDEDIRTTCHGISAASGKLGAVVGSIMMPFLLHSVGPSGVMIVSGCIALLGLLISLLNLVPETHNMILHRNEDDSLVHDDVQK